MRRLAQSRAGAWVFARSLHHVDRAAYRLSGGRGTFSSFASGLPVAMLATTGARSGLRRTSPVLAIPHGDALIVVATNWGGRGHPSWYYNLRADPEATVTVRGESRALRARELHGDERAHAFAHAASIYPGFRLYEKRVTTREIPVLRLEAGTG